jgi:hypothetical protein
MLDGEISYACPVHHIQVGIIRHVGWANSTSNGSPEDGQPPEPPVSQSTARSGHSSSKGAKKGTWRSHKVAAQDPQDEEWGLYRAPKHTRW